MSSQTDAHDHSHDHDDGGVHAHISSVPFYVAVFVGLLCLTIATVGQSYVDLGKANLIFLSTIFFIGAGGRSVSLASLPALGLDRGPAAALTNDSSQ